jgi:hypothetical protein
MKNSLKRLNKTPEISHFFANCYNLLNIKEFVNQQTTIRTNDLEKINNIKNNSGNRPTNFGTRKLHIEFDNAFNQQTVKFRRNIYKKK